MTSIAWGALAGAVTFFVGVILLVLVGEGRGRRRTDAEHDAWYLDLTTGRRTRLDDPTQIPPPPTRIPVQHTPSGEPSGVIEVPGHIHLSDADVNRVIAQLDHVLGPYPCRPDVPCHDHGPRCSSRPCCPTCLSRA